MSEPWDEDGKAPGRSCPDWDALAVEAFGVPFEQLTEPERWQLVEDHREDWFGCSSPNRWRQYPE